MQFYKHVSKRRHSPNTTDHHDPRHDVVVYGSGSEVRLCLLVELIFS